MLDESWTVFYRSLLLGRPIRDHGLSKKALFKYSELTDWHQLFHHLSLSIGRRDFRLSLLLIGTGEVDRKKNLKKALRLYSVLFVKQSNRIWKTMSILWTIFLPFASVTEITRIFHQLLHIYSLNGNAFHIPVILGIFFFFHSTREALFLSLH